MPTNRHFKHESTIRTSLERVITFHEDPAAIRKLTMPPLVVQVLRDDRVSNTAGTLVFRLWFGPIPIRWNARHEPGPSPTSFVDLMEDGPMEHWRHEHIFEEDGDSVRLIDRIELRHFPGWRGLLTRLFFDGLPLRMLFMYRHWITKRATTG